MADCVEHNQIYHLPSTSYPLNTFSNLHDVPLLIFMVIDDILRLASQPRARQRHPHSDGVPPRREF
jgi:hypothetical protein